MTSSLIRKFLKNKQCYKRYYTVNLISTYDHVCVIMKSNLIRKPDNHYWICKNNGGTLCTWKNSITNPLWWISGGFPPKADFFRIKRVFLSLQILTSKSVNSRLWMTLNEIWGTFHFRKIKCMLSLVHKWLKDHFFENEDYWLDGKRNYYFK